MAQYWLVVIMISLPSCVDPIHEENRSDTNLLTISSCVLANTSQLHHYCTDSHDQKDTVTLEDLNTIQISEKLCGDYKYHQGQTCHDIVLLFLKSNSKGLCISSSIANDSLTIPHANIINDINHKYFPNCSSVGTLLILGDHEFSCTLQNFDELEKIEFVIRGYNASIGDWWTAMVTITIQHNCSEVGRSRSVVPYYVGIIAAIIISSLVVIFCIICFVSYFKKSKTEVTNRRASEQFHCASEDNEDNLTDNNLGKRNLSVQNKKESTAHCKQAGTIVSNPNASEHDVEDNNHYTKPVDTTAGLEMCTISITVEASQSCDQQSADDQNATSEHHSNFEDDLTDSKDSVATISPVCTTDVEQYITEPKQVTSPYASITKGSLPGHKRNSMSMDTLKRMINGGHTTAPSSETHQQNLLHSTASTGTTAK